MEYWERPQQLADRCARGGALCTARRSPAIPYRSMAFFGQELPIIPSTSTVLREEIRNRESSTSCASAIERSLRSVGRVPGVRSVAS